MYFVLKQYVTQTAASFWLSQPVRGDVGWQPRSQDCTPCGL